MLIGTIAVLILAVGSLEAKTITKDSYEDLDDNDDDAIVGRTDNDKGKDSSRLNGTTATTTVATTLRSTKTFEELMAEIEAQNDEISNWDKIKDLDKTDTPSPSGVNGRLTPISTDTDVTFQTFDQMRADQQKLDDLQKSLKDMKTYNWNDYKTPDYTYTPNSSYYYNGVNGYHISGGFVAIALILVFIRCCLICCRYQNQTRTRSIILVRETPVHALIIARHRTNSKEDLMGDAEPPADDPPTYEECARDSNPMTPNMTNTSGPATATAADGDRPVNSQ